IVHRYWTFGNHLWLNINRIAWMIQAFCLKKGETDIRPASHPPIWFVTQKERGFCSMKRFTKRLTAVLLVTMLILTGTVQCASAAQYLTLAAVASSSGLFPYCVSIGKVINTYCPDFNITVSNPAAIPITQAPQRRSENREFDVQHGL
ncbi:MAG: hypothetical protein ACLUMK_10700, partial [Christensenellales bacterium]